MFKRGNITSDKIIVIVLLIGALVVVGALLLALFDQRNLSEREICVLSVVERATAPEIIGNKIPLKCSVEKICITSEKRGECKQFVGEEKARRVLIDMPSFEEYEKNKFDFDKKRKEAIKLIEAETAGAMYDCWIMTGQGRLDIFRGSHDEDTIDDISGVLGIVGAENLPQVREPQCLICSRVAIAEDVIQKDKELFKKYDNDLLKSPGDERISGAELSVLANVNVNNYLVREKVPGSQLTYLQTFVDESTKGYAGVDKVDLSQNPGIVSNPTNQIAIAFMQIITEADPKDVASTTGQAVGFAVGGGGILSRGVKLLHPYTLLLTAVAAVGGGFLAADYAYDVQERNQQVAFGSCSNYVIKKDEAKLGCNLIKPLEWDVDKINSFCVGGIEGNL